MLRLPRFAIALFVPLLALVAVLTPASATPATDTHTIYIDHGPGPWVPCTVATVNTETCDVRVWEHFIWSEPDIHCTGSPGSYTSCKVYEMCDEEADGFVLAGAFHCTPLAPIPSAGSGNFREVNDGYVDIAVDACQFFDAFVTATALGVTSAETPIDSVQICVDAWGPYAS